MKLLLVSDTHGERAKTVAILKQHPAMDGYYHLGDIGFAKEYIPQCSIVKGNHDEEDFAEAIVVELEGIKTLITHGDCFEKLLLSEMADGSWQFQSWEDCLFAIYDQIVKVAKENECRAVFFGHTHTAFFQKYKGIYLCNPGSLIFSHDGNPCSYAIVHIDKNGMSCEHCYVD